MGGARRRARSGGWRTGPEMPGASRGYDREEIRRRVDIVELVSPHVALRKRGSRLVGLCPFHEERTPSFTLDPETGLWHCFGCKAGGDVFRFVEMIEKITFPEALELLARRLGVAPRTPQEAGRVRARERLRALHEAACAFFQRCLLSPAGKAAKAYIERRGVSAEAMARFALGYAPASWDALVTVLGQRGFSRQELERAGLVVAGEWGVYDRFRDRLIFPIRDPSGQVIAFGGRALGEDQQPKYLNSPETELFQKGRVLYGMDLARRAMADRGRAIVVEGYLDAIACHEAGFAETVATMGTALTGEHVELLRRRTRRLALAFDADSAGLAAALRGRELFERAELPVEVVTLPEGVDPDEFIRDRGAEAFAELVEAAPPMTEWELRRALARAGAADKGDRLGGIREAVAVLARLPAGVEREHYTGWLAREWAAGASPERITSLERAIREELARSSTRRTAGRRRNNTVTPQGGRESQAGSARPAADRVQREVLAGMIRQGGLAARYAAELAREDFEPELRVVFEAIQGLLAGGAAITEEAVVGAVPAEARGALAELLLAELPGERSEEAVREGVARLQEARCRRQLVESRQELAGAATEGEREAILRRIGELRRRVSELAGRRVMGSD